MANLPPKAFYTLRIAKQMRNVKYTLIAVDECIQRYLSIHYASTHSSEISSLFSQITYILNNIMEMLGIEYDYGAPINYSHTPILINRTTKSSFKMLIAKAIRDTKNYLNESYEYIIEYIIDNKLEGKDEIKHNLIDTFNLINNITNIIELDHDYGTSCTFDVSFDCLEEDDEDEEEDDDDDEYEDDQVPEFDYDNNNDDIDALKAYCNEVFTLNSCKDKNYSALIDQSFENRMADAIPVTLNDIARIRKNLLIWVDIYDYDNENIDELTCDLFLKSIKVEREIHSGGCNIGNNDIYLSISSLLYLWYILKFCQHNSQITNN